MNRETILFIIVLISCIGLLIVLWKYKKEYLYNIAYYAVIQAEELYRSKQGQEKLAFAIRSIKTKLPWWLSWLVSEKLIRSTIEQVLSNLQSTFKSSKYKQLAIIDNIRTYGITDTRLNKLQTEINSNGYVEGYIEGRTNLKGDSNIVAGIRAGAKF